MQRPTSATSSEAPIASARDRIIGYDLARSLAILGMIVVHFSMVMAADRHSESWIQPILGFLDGRVAATFVVLAGIGFTLVTRKAAESHDPEQLDRMRLILLKRGLFLLAQVTQLAESRVGT